MDMRQRARTYHVNTREDAATIEKQLEADNIPFDTTNNPNDFQPYSVTAYPPRSVEIEVTP